MESKNENNNNKTNSINNDNNIAFQLMMS